MTTTLIMQLGHVPIATYRLRPPETSHPNLHMGVHAAVQQHTGRKFAYKADNAADWQHGNRTALYEFIAANVGRTVYVRLLTDVTKYAR